MNASVEANAEAATARAVPNDMQGDDCLSEAGSDVDGEDDLQDDDERPPVPENEAAEEEADAEAQERAARRTLDTAADQDESEDEEGGEEEADDEEDEADGTPEEEEAVEEAGAVAEQSDKGGAPKLDSAKLPHVTWSASTERYIVLDIETSGGKKARNRIISLAAICCDAAGKQLGTPFNELVFITSAIAYHAAKHHKLTKADLAKAKGDFSVVGKLWCDWMAPLVAGCSSVLLVAHNGLACDFRLVCAEMRRSKLELPAGPTYALLDTLHVIRKSPKLDYHSASEADWQARNKPTAAQRRSGKPGAPSMTQSNVADYVLRVRAAHANAGRRPGDTAPRRATFASYCGAAHDALADVRGCVLTLTDAEPRAVEACTCKRTAPSPHAAPRHSSTLCCSRPIYALPAAPSFSPRMRPSSSGRAPLPPSGSALAAAVSSF